MSRQIVDRSRNVQKCPRYTSIAQQSTCSHALTMLPEPLGLEDLATSCAMHSLKGSNMRQSCSKRCSGSPQPQKPMLEEVWNLMHGLVP